MTEHTAGPWEVDPRYPLIVRPSGVLVEVTNLRNHYGATRATCSVAAARPTSYQPGAYITFEEAKANARLIAASPMLADRAEALLNSFIERNAKLGHQQEQALAGLSRAVYTSGYGR